MKRGILAGEAPAASGSTRAEIHLRWALAISPLLFVLLGVPLAIKVQRGGRSIGFGLSLLIVLAYYVLTMGGLAVGQRGVLPAAPSWYGIANRGFGGDRQCTYAHVSAAMTSKPSLRANPYWRRDLVQRLEWYWNR